MRQELGIGLFGTGFMGRAHSNALINLRYGADIAAPRPRLVCVAGGTEERLWPLQERFGWEHATTDWRALARDERVQVFDNCGRNNLHAEPTLAAIEAGKHVICEKPLALDADQALRMLEAAEVAGVVHMCAFNYRFFPAIGLAKRMIEAGDLGDPTHFRSAFLIPSAVSDGPESEWRLQAAETGSGALGDLGAHHIDVARYLVGEIADVVGKTTIFVPERHGMEVEVDDAVEALGTFESGATAVWTASRAAAGHALQSRIEIDGTRGSLIFDLAKLNELRFSDGSGWKTIFCTRADDPDMDLWWPHGQGIGWGDSFVNQLRRAMVAVGAGESVAPRGATFRDGYRCAEVIDAILASAASGRRQAIAYRDAATVRSSG
jgi:predicted dehydrogenase